MDTLGIVECRSIAMGASLSDSMIKAADINLIKAGTICPGKYIIYISGDRSSVKTAISMAEARASEKETKLVGSYSISNISPQVIRALGRGFSSGLEKEECGTVSALGVVECNNVSSCIEAADYAVKKSDVYLGRLSLAQGIAGKAYFVVAGDLASVNEAVEVAKTNLEKKLIEAVVIARPEAAVIKNLMGG